MRFGVNLGPFRVGVSSKGRISGGVGVGPFSVSGGVGGARRRRRPARQAPQGMVVDLTLDEAVRAAQAQGWKVSYHRPNQSAYLTLGWEATSMRVVNGGVLVRPAMANRTALFIVLAVILGVLACCLGPVLSTR